MEFLNNGGIWVYIFIFLGKIIEVAISTLRMVLISRGERTMGSFIAFFEMILWLIITALVLTDIYTDTYKLLVLALAFAVGNYVGSWLEGKLAFGLSTIEVISHENEQYKELLEQLRASNLAVTVLNGEGKEGTKKVMLIHLKRSRISNTVRLIQSIQKNCVITITDVKFVRGGFIRK